MARVYLNPDKKVLGAFKRCHDRVRGGKSPSIFWKRDNNGYELFAKEIGAFPEGMNKPSVGRIDHDLGYEPNNIRWEEHRHNSVKRKGTKWEGCLDAEVEFKTVKFKKGSIGHFEHQKAAAKKRWSDPNQREAARKRALTNNPNPNCKGTQNA